MARRLARWDVAAALYALIALAAVAGVLLTPGTLGHHWDWLIPSDPAELRRFASTAGWAWQDFDFGSYVTFHYSTTLTNFLFGMVGFAGLNGAFVTKTLLLGSIFGSGIGMRFLLLTIAGGSDERDGAYATLSGMLYALAPFSYNQIIAGDQSALIGDALSPIAIGLALRSVYSRDGLWLPYALSSSILLAIAVASAQVFAFTLAIAWTICLLLRWSVASAIRLACLTAAAVALSAFWILPALVARDSVHTVVQTASLDRAFATYEQFSNFWLTLTTVAFPGDFYLHALGPGAPLFFLAYAILMALCVVALIAHPSRLLRILAGIFAVTAFLPLGGNGTVGPAIIALFTALLPYSLFLRTPQHLMFVVSLVFPIVVYLAARTIPPKLFGPSLALGAVILLGYGQGFFVHSNFLGLIGPFRETAGERATIAAAGTPGSDPYRTLFIPNTESYYYHPGVFDYHFEGGDEPQIRFLPNATMGAGAKWTPYDRTQHLLMALDELIPSGADRQTQRMLLQLAGIKLIVVHAIGAPGSGVRIGVADERSGVQRSLRRSGLVWFVQSFDDRSLWRFGEPVPRAYAPDCIFGVPAEADPYEVLALAPAASDCARPATVAASFPARSEDIVPAVRFRAATQAGLALPIVRTNVDVTSDGDDGFSAPLPPGVQDVEMLALPAVPRNASGIAFRMSSSAWRRVWVQLYAPDSHNCYVANVDFSGRVQDVALNFSRFGVIGNPSRNRIRYLRFASRNAELREEAMSFGQFRWIDRPSHSVPTPYLTVAGSVWDRYYFGGDREQVLFEAQPNLRPVYARVQIWRRGAYNVFANVQQSKRTPSLQAYVDGKIFACTSDRTPGDVTQRLVRLASVVLRHGRHQLGLRYCRVPERTSTQDVGVRSLVIAAAGFLAPAARATGGARLTTESAGSFRVATSGRLLVFSDSFDDRWSATQGGLVLKHVLVNGYANGWIVPNPAAGDVVLSFGPQKWLTLGIAATAVLAFAALCTIVGFAVRRKPLPS